MSSLAMGLTQPDERRFMRLPFLNNGVIKYLKVPVEAMIAYKAQNHSIYKGQRRETQPFARYFRKHFHVLYEKY
jgi:hypothetical protein